jgi:hypothetical protein
MIEALYSPGNKVCVCAWRASGPPFPGLRNLANLEGCLPVMELLGVKDVESRTMLEATSGVCFRRFCKSALGQTVSGCEDGNGDVLVMLEGI